MGGADFLCPKGTCLCGANTCYTSQYGCKNGGLTQNPADNGGFCPATNSTASVVKYGVGSPTSTASGSASSYTMNPAVTAGSIYVSGLLHAVTLTGLTPGTKYTYTVGPISSNPTAVATMIKRRLGDFLRSEGFGNHPHGCCCA